MNFDKLTNESTGGTIVKIKRPLKLILISLGILISLILVITTVSIIFLLGESTISPTFEDSTAKTYEIHSSLNRYHSMKLSVSCRIPGAPNEKCPEDVKAFEELVEREILTLLKEKGSTVDVYFSENIVTIKNSSTVHLYKRGKVIRKEETELLTEIEKEGFVYNQEDFGQNWTLGINTGELSISFDANLKSVACSVNSNESSSPVGCPIRSHEIFEGVTTLFKGILGATRLNGTVAFGKDKPWHTTFELDVTSQTDGEPVRKYIQQFLADDIALCKCLVNTDSRFVTFSEEAEDLETCFKTLKIRESVQVVMREFHKSRCY